MLKVGIIGAGGMGRLHAGCLGQLSQTKVVAVTDVKPEAAEKLAQNTGARIYPDVVGLLSDTDVDIVAVCTPTVHHCDAVVQAAQAGKQIFCEKPLARTLKEGRKMLSAVKAAGVKFMVGHVLRFFPEYRRAKELIDSGNIGRPGIARLSRMGVFPAGWYSDFQQSGGLALDLLIHDFDFLNWCFGKPLRVYAQGLNQQGVHEHLDYALALIRYENGVIAQVEGSWAIPQGWYTRFEIAGDGGLIDFDSRKTAPVTLLTKQKGLLQENPTEQSPYFLELHHFVDCILQESEPEITGQDALEALKVSLAAVESIQTGKPVTL